MSCTIKFSWSTRASESFIDLHLAWVERGQRSDPVRARRPSLARKARRAGGEPALVFAGDGPVAAAVSCGLTRRVAPRIERDRRRRARRADRRVGVGGA